VGLDILLIDDEADLRLVLEEALRDADHRVVAAGDGAEGLNHAVSKVFDVVICDVRLPKIDGLTLFRRIRQESPSTDVILMTAYAEVSDAVAVRRHIDRLCSRVAQAETRTGRGGASDGRIP